MELTNVSEKDNPLFSRKDVSAHLVHFAASPNRKEVLALLATRFKVEPTVVYIKKIDGSYGGEKAVLTACIYSSVDALNKYTHAKRRLRTGEKKEKTAKPKGTKSKK